MSLLTLVISNRGVSIVSQSKQWIVINEIKQINVFSRAFNYFIKEVAFSKGKGYLVRT